MLLNHNKHQKLDWTNSQGENLEKVVNKRVQKHEKSVMPNRKFNVFDIEYGNLLTNEKGFWIYSQVIM